MTMSDALRRRDLAQLTDDPAAARVPRVLALDPRRVAYHLVAGIRADDPTISEAEALERAFTFDPDLRAAFKRYRFTLADVPRAERMTLGRPMFLRRDHSSTKESDM